MALVLRISASYCFSHRRPLGPGLISSTGSSCRTSSRRIRKYSTCCSAADAEETSGQGPAQRPLAGSHTPSWLESDRTKDAYAGWAPLDNNYDADRLAGILQIGAGIALAIAFSLVTYTAYSRKGSKHAVVYSVTTQQDTELPSESCNGSVDDYKPLASDTSSTPSSIGSKQEVHGENPQPDVASASDLHQKKTAPGQDSFLSKDVTELSDEENVVSAEPIFDSDVEASLDHDTSHSEDVENKAGSDAMEVAQPINDVASPSIERGNNLLIDDKSRVISNGTPIQSAGVPPDESGVDESDIESTSKIHVLNRDKEEFGDFSLRNALSTGSIEGSEDSNSAVGMRDANTSTDTKVETNLRVSVAMVVPKGTAEDTLEYLELDAPSIVDELDLIVPKPGHMNKRPSVIETLTSLGSESELSHSESVESFGIPAPSTPSSAAQATSAGVVVPATVDHEHEQALAALQALKVIEPGIEAGGICTRREYARWLIAITRTLARNPAHKVFPAMYIDTVSELAFNDVVPEDPDFPYIQGLAEAGLISSNLSRHDADENGRSTDGAVFLPDSPLSRQDLVCWKMSLEGHSFQAVDKQKLKAQTGFIDIDRISEDALPFLAKDLAAGEQSIISTAFGYTRRFQPGKPVTRGQAAIALVTGEAADIVAEELTRLEAEDIAEAAVVAELALEARAHQQVDEYFNTELKLEKESRFSMEKELEEVKEELKRVINEREIERLSLESAQAAVQAERDLLHKFRQETEEQLQSLTVYRVEVEIEKDRLENLRKAAEEKGQALADLKAGVEVEKNALILARLWAEDEAKKARAHAKMLEEVRKRWEGQGIQVRVDKELDDDNISGLGWQYGDTRTELNKFLQRAPIQDILAKAGDLRSRVVERFMQLIEAAGRAFTIVRRRASESVQVIHDRTVKSAQVISGKACLLQQETFAVVSRKVVEIQDATVNSVACLSSNVTDGTRKIVDGFLGEAQKLAGKFKS